MAERLSKSEWEQKIKEKIIDFFENTDVKEFTDKDMKVMWWVSPVNTVSGMRLTEMGYNWFTKAGIVFHKYECSVPAWNGALLLGLSRMPCPYFIESSSKLGNFDEHFTFCIPDEEYAMMLMFLNNDLIQFAKGFLR
jgi:hypothetical protein